MEQFENLTDSEIIKNKLRLNFDGKIVRKDLTKKIKEGANVPVYVLEFLLDCHIFGLPRHTHNQAELYTKFHRKANGQTFRGIRLQ